MTGAAGGIGSRRRPRVRGGRCPGLAVDLDQAAVDVLVGGFEGAGHAGVGIGPAWTGDRRCGHRARARELGGVYGLVNLAAVLRRRPSLDEVTEDDWDLQHDVNLKAAFFLARAAGRAMVEAGQGGRIILFSSQGWWTGGFGGSVVYASTKGGDRRPCAAGSRGRSVRTASPSTASRPARSTRRC